MVDMAAIEHFVKHKLYENKSLEDIQKMLVSAGWDEITVNSIIRKYK